MSVYMVALQYALFQFPVKTHCLYLLSTNYNRILLYNTSINSGISLSLHFTWQSQLPVACSQVGASLRFRLCPHRQIIADNLWLYLSFMRLSFCMILLISIVNTTLWMVVICFVKGASETSSYKNWNNKFGKWLVGSCLPIALASQLHQKLLEL